MNELFIDIHTHRSDRKRAIVNLFHNDETEPNGFVSQGLHPWHIDEQQYFAQLELLQTKLSSSKVLAIGECGLDALQPTPFKAQKEVFLWHCRRSEDLSKPLIIHCVKSFNQLIEIKQSFSPSQGWVVHGYRSGIGVAGQLVNHGFYLSLGTNLLGDPEKLKAYLDMIPLSRMFFESDENATDVQAIYEFSSDYLNISDRKSVV